MVLYLVGLGLGDEKDITVRASRPCAAARCAPPPRAQVASSPRTGSRCVDLQRVYLEAYTSVLGVDVARLELFYERPLIVADREAVENGADAILRDADTHDVAFLVVGDPLAATTHADLMQRAKSAASPARSCTTPAS